MADALVYLYAIGDAALASLVLGGLVGVGGAPVRVLIGGRLAAVVSSVEPQQFGEESLRRNLENLPWLTATARAHHRVVDAIGRDHPIAPLRLATVYLDDENVRALIGAQEGAFAAALDRIRGRHEWGVKAFAAGRPDPEQGDDDSALGPGAAYLSPPARCARARIAFSPGGAGGRRGPAPQARRRRVRHPTLPAAGSLTVGPPGRHGAQCRLPRRRGPRRRRRSPVSLAPGAHR